MEKLDYSDYGDLLFRSSNEEDQELMLNQSQSNCSSSCNSGGGSSGETKTS